MKNALKSLLSLGVLVAGLGAAAPARAQDEGSPVAPPPASSPPPAARSTYSGGGAGIGVGAALWLSGLSGAQVVWDQSLFHLEGLLGFASDDAPGDNITTINFGVAGWYHLHQGASSDFSLGGGVGVSNVSQGDASAQALVLEPGAQARVFLTSNVGLHARVGLPVVFGDGGTDLGNERVALFGHVSGAFGFTYFFR